ncbi:Hypothetical predicted protein [Paramuricea clavata]|uniref:Uncharacterized protein n=1 Tax=Paramuricea clavata TaxID=317549 RepID=A0A6S7JBA3_PARCT|nr:Hypothetical predicted protein [Paramuricea clavata]
MEEDASRDLFDLSFDFLPDDLSNSDNLLDNTWKNNTDSVETAGAVQNVLGESGNNWIDTELSGQNSVAVQQDVLDLSLSLPENLFGTLEEFDQDFQKQLLNIYLATIIPTESIKNSFNTETTAGNLSSEPNLGNNVNLEPSLEPDAPLFPSQENRDTLGEINVKPNVHTTTACLGTESDNLPNNGNLEPSNSLDSTIAAEVPELSPSLPVSPANTTIANDSSLNMNQLGPDVFSETPPSPSEILVGMNVEPSSRKRSREENSNSAKRVAPASKKIMGQPCSSRDEETVPDKIVKNKKKNTASRLRGPSKKKCVLEQEKQLEKENEELKGKVEELSREVEVLKNYIVSKLKGQCPRCEK